MSVYVDDANIPYGRMFMSHLWADTEEELLNMVDLIGVNRKWIQRTQWVHFDIAKRKKELAIKNGAILTDKFAPAEHVAKLRLAKLQSMEPTPEILSLIANQEKMIANVAFCRGLREDNNNV